MPGIIPCNSANQTAGFCNTDKGSVSFSSGKMEYTDYGYVVATWSAYTFLIAFALAALIHAGMGIWKRHWWVLCTLSFGCAIEAIGWGGRLMSVLGLNWNENMGGFWEYDHNSFIIQIVCTVIAPTLYSAANYIILGKLINSTGGLFSLLTPRSFSILFMFADFVCLVVQGAGGGIAGTAVTTDGANQGALIMTGGVVVQLVITVLFVGVLIDFVRRFRTNKPALRQYHPLPNVGFMRRVSNPSGAIPLDRYDASAGSSSPARLNKPDEGSVAERGGIALRHAPFQQDISSRNVWIMVGMVVFTTLLIVIRSVYRSVELTDGWTGPIAVDQGLFLGMDAFLMALLAWSYVVVSPASFLPRQKL